MTDEATITAIVVAGPSQNELFYAIISSQFTRIGKKGEKALAKEPMNAKRTKVINLSSIRAEKNENCRR